MLSQLNAGVIQWNENSGVLDGANVSLSDVKTEVSDYMQKLLDEHGDGQGYVESLYVGDSIIRIDQDSIYQVSGYTEGEGQGGPSSITFGQNVTLLYDTPLTFRDELVGFSLGEAVYNDGEWSIEPGSLTVNLTEAFIHGLDWQPDVDAGVYSHLIMQCSFFENYSGAPTVLLNGLGAGRVVAGFEYKGYVGGLDALEDGQIGVVAIREQTQWVAGTQDWPGMSLVLVAKSNVGAPDLPTPEPTTGTLSLLALAGLAARRRRK